MAMFLWKARTLGNLTNAISGAAYDMGIRDKRFADNSLEPPLTGSLDFHARCTRYKHLNSKDAAKEILVELAAEWAYLAELENTDASKDTAHLYAQAVRLAAVNLYGGSQFSYAVQQMIEDKRAGNRT